MPIDMHWQVQEAKQRFSELLRKAHTDGPQVVTRHGEDIAVVVDISEYHRLRDSEGSKTFTEHLLAFPKLDLSDDEIDALFARPPEPASNRETPFVGPDWE